MTSKHDPNASSRWDASAASPTLPLALDAPKLRESLRSTLAARERRVFGVGPWKKSAVLVPLFERDIDTHVLLLRRAENMRSHSGQVAFPGGKHDPDDDSLLTTALREAEEEVGLRKDAVDVLGALDDLVTITGFAITPYVGWIPHDAELLPNPSEVARVFSAPLRAFAVPPADVHHHVVAHLGYRIDGEMVWGATAAIARGLAALLEDAFGGARRR